MTQIPAKPGCDAGPSIFEDAGEDAGETPDAAMPMVDSGTPDAGGPDGGKADAGAIDAGPPAPEDVIFSIGLTDNSGSVPQTASSIQLKFRNGVASQSTVVAKRVTAPPTLDGNANDWIGLPESVIPMLSRGGTVGMSAAVWAQETTALYGRELVYDFEIPWVAVRAAYDDQRIYFLVQWSDPTETRARNMWMQDGGVWVRSQMNEDRVYFGFDINKSTPAFQALGCNGACHLQKNIGDYTDAGRPYRMRMHTNAPGELVDYWQWRASTSDPWGMADDGYIDEVSRKQDGVNDWVAANSITIPDAGTFPQFMGEGGINANPWYLFKPDAGRTPAGVPFDGTGALPESVLPGWVLQRASPNRDDVSAVGRYSAGRWTVEFSRLLVTQDSKDTQFPLK